MSAMAASLPGPDINASLTCLGFKDAGIKGRYEASLEVEGKGEAAESPRALQGPLTFRLRMDRWARSAWPENSGGCHVTAVFGGKNGTVSARQ